MPAPTTDIFRADLFGSITRAETQSPEEEGFAVFDAVVSTEAEIWDVVIDHDSWLLDRFSRNPVILWMHDRYTPPIGRALSIGVEDRVLKARIGFDMSEANPLGRLMADQYERGILNTFSVGWRTGQFIDRSTMPKDDPWYLEDDGHYLARENDLLEISGTTVPADMDAEVQRAMADAGLSRNWPPSVDVGELVRSWLDTPEGAEALNGIVDSIIAKRTPAPDPGSVPSRGWFGLPKTRG